MSTASRSVGSGEQSKWVSRWKTVSTASTVGQRVKTVGSISKSKGGKTVSITIMSCSGQING